MLKTTRTILAAGALLLATAQAGLAQTNIVSPITLNPPTVSFNYLQFSVTTAGYFNLYSNSVQQTSQSYNDPMFYLFSGLSSDGSGLGSLIGYSDDGYGCGTSSNGLDSCIQMPLSVGDYTLATGLYLSTENDARNNVHGEEWGTGYYSNTGDHDITVFINSQDGVAYDVSAVPEPASMILLATGLFGVAAATRARRKAA